MRYDNGYSFLPVNFNFIRYYFGIQIAFLLKRWITVNYKIRKTTLRIKFLRSCKNYNVHPMHLSHLLKFKLQLYHYRSRQKLDKLIDYFKYRIIEIEIFDLYRSLDSLNYELLGLSYKLSNQLPVNILNKIWSYHSVSFMNYYNRLEHENDKKLSWLMNKKEQAKLRKIKPIFFNMKMERVSNDTSVRCDDGNTVSNLNIELDPKNFIKTNLSPIGQLQDKWFINLSNIAIPPEVCCLLQLNEGFYLPNSSNNKKTAVYEFIKDIESNITKVSNTMKSKIRGTVVPQLNRFLDKKISVDPNEKRLSYLHKCTLKFCRENPDIIFTKADKGNVTVAMDVHQYQNKMVGMLNDSETYNVVTRNPIKNIEAKLTTILKRWLSQGYITKKVYFSLNKHSDCSLPKAYGLPKVHKKDTPLRIIVSSRNTTLYSFASYLHNILNDNLPQSRGYVKNSFDLYEQLSNKRISGDEILISLDVVSLFTNVPRDLVMEGIKKRWSLIESNTSIPEEEFLSAVQFVLSSTYFTFKNIIYQQTYGTPMGSPLSPIIADIAMQDLESIALNNIGIDLKFYFRYVDDILLVSPKDQVDNILNIFNSINNRLQFTIEFENNRNINFLDILINVHNETLILNWYHKPTYSGRYLSFVFGHPIHHKIDTIYGLIDRAILLSHPSFYQKNLEFIIDILLTNGYPIDLIFNKMRMRLKKLFFEIKEKKTPASDKTEKKIIVFPYIKNVSETVASAIDKNQFIIGYKCLNRLNGIIKRHKDREPTEANNNVIYKINCNDCDVTYVGQTKRKLRTRVNEHRKNINGDAAGYSVITEHRINYNHSFDWDNPEILDYEQNYYKRLISEMIHIKAQKNSINLNSDTEYLDVSYFDLLDRIGNNNFRDTR